MSRAGIYLDNAASTPVDPRVIEVMADALARHGANPTAAHDPGERAADAVARAREPVAAAIGAAPDDLIWTSGASEANNLAIQGVAAAFGRQPGHMITLCTEHPAVLGPMAALEAQGWSITRLPVDANGRCEPETLAAALRPDTRLVSVMQVNNETGVCQDLAAIGEALRAHPAAFHVDAAQGAGKLPLDVEAIGADLVSLSSHKLHGPKGIGALYVRRRPAPHLAAVWHGGGQERGLRPGTPATHQILGMGKAYALAAEHAPAENRRIAALRDRLWQRLAAVGNLVRNGGPEHVAPGLLNVSVGGVHADALHYACAAGEPALAVSRGSACAAGSAASSYVLRAMGREPALAAASLRLSLGRFTSAADVDTAGRVIAAHIERLRAMAPMDAPADAVVA
ncbi:cysteine desulfurase family protein [Salinisphaera sp. P385]|uniref:Cysteine desulfurase family protein n=1 Tax=Spectribacter acetivorans TaxID=3075603 RepID=A0ABU3BAL9_9GAMM|nr:cysteine desulfurase family protein [Salinisphaera sp. P385]MDT0619155.1 cysteine desulfurase family protein [Salinisphaera sp. P385]